ncbi:MAG: HAMP domain-containing protein [Acidobacteria bacterium]|nr:MAG: HAMP domain-containing protein [Acidobacteriota bacterium]REJ98898.1 MAG: HAMP domain-containing protein [Acidobacteriota bacterium]REK16382.1 MAG: HAMP domain-containing protein [Acidobacteriota bacterium]REK44063.1 MAG: HAMP domain-containing protein [Acidobacteriota bacterium]
MIFTSIRFRLTVWYAAALALALAVFGGIFYFAIDRTVRGLADDSIEDSANALITTIQSKTRLQGGARPAKDVFPEVLEDFRFQFIVFAVVDESANVVSISPQGQRIEDPSVTPFDMDREHFPANQAIEAASEGSGFLTIQVPGEPEVRVFGKSFEVLKKKYYAVAVRPLRTQLELLSYLRLMIAAAVPFALLLAFGGGFYLAGRSLRPVGEMAEKASEISSSNLAERLPRRSEDDELSNLANAFNGVLDRLEEAFGQQKRFMADASHELRTPLSIIRGESDVSLQVPDRDPEEYRESLEIIGQEARRLSRIVDDLFILARADSGALKLEENKFFLDEAASECARSFRTLAERKNARLEIEAKQGLQIVGDESLVRRVIANLLDNAVKYSEPGSRILLECSESDGICQVDVSNTGSEITGEDSEKVFERFYRADKVRSHNETDSRGSGAGLGLSIARSIAELHGGALDLVASAPRSTHFRLALPKNHAKIDRRPNN